MRSTASISFMLLGPSGCGKGTQGKLVEKMYRIPHLSAGDILRQEVAQGTDIGRRVEAILKSGSLVADELITEIMRNRLSGPDCKRGYVLDGYPRTIGQADDLKGILSERNEKLLAVIELALSEDEIVRRLLGRLQCVKCGSSFHTEFNPSQREGKCDRCGRTLKRRIDDTEEIIRSRIEVYKRDTAALISYYADAGLLVKVSGAGRVDEVFSRIRSLIDERRQSVA